MPPASAPPAPSAAPSGMVLAGVSRAFAGGAGIRSVDLAVEPGEVHALVGLNGAGKSTLMKVLLGMLRPDAGRATIAGVEVGRAGAGVWSRVGHLVEAPLAAVRYGIDARLGRTPNLGEAWAPIWIRPGSWVIRLVTPRRIGAQASGRSEVEVDEALRSRA